MSPEFPVSAWSTFLPSKSNVVVVVVFLFWGKYIVCWEHFYLSLQALVAFLFMTSYDKSIMARRQVMRIKKIITRVPWLLSWCTIKFLAIVLKGNVWHLVRRGQGSHDIFRRKATGFNDLNWIPLWKKNYARSSSQLGKIVLTNSQFAWFLILNKPPRG